MSKRKRIIIIDDERDFAEELSLGLETAGLDVMIAQDGQEGLVKVKKEKPELILLDVIMPKINGYQLCRQLKADPKTNSIPVIMLTAKTQESDKYWGKEAGADDYVTKPFELKDLVQKIRLFLKEDA